MTNILNDAREVADYLDGNAPAPAFAGPKVRAAADEIERLRAGLLEIQEASNRPGVINQDWLYRHVTNLLK